MPLLEGIFPIFVDRRIGGLEMSYSPFTQRFIVDRRIGGLEKWL